MEDFWKNITNKQPKHAHSAQHTILIFPASRKPPHVTWTQRSVANVSQVEGRQVGELNELVPLEELRDCLDIISINSISKVRPSNG